MKKILFFMSLSFNVFSASIVATVNDDIITSYDLEQRFKLLEILSEKKVEENQRKKMEKDLLDVLIDENIKQNSAKAVGIELGNDDINRALAFMEKSMSMSMNELKERMKNEGIPFTVLENQIKADLMWMIYMRQNSFVQVSEKEVEDFKKKNDIYFKGEVELWDIVQMAVPKDKLITTLDKVQNIRTCADFEKMAQSGLTGSGKKDNVMAKYLPEIVYNELKGTVDNEVKGPLDIGQFYLFAMKCREHIEKQTPPNDEEIKNILLGQKMEIESDKILQKLKDKFVIEKNNG